MEAAEQFGLLPNLKTKAQVLVTVFSPELTNNSIKLAADLRNYNVRTELYPDPNAKLDKQIKYADKKGIPFVAIIGENEARQDLVTIKNLGTKKQKTLSLEEIIKLLKTT